MSEIAKCEEFKVYLRATAYIDSDHPDIKAYAAEKVLGAIDQRESGKAILCREG